MNPLTVIPGLLGLAGDWLNGRGAARAQDDRYDLNARQTYAAEYGARGRRYAFDAVVDGVNRLVRPSFTFGVVALFWWAAANPADFAVFATAVSAAPDGLWAVLAIVVGFWFGGRLAGKDLRWKTPPATPAPKRVGVEGPNAVERRYRARFWPD